MENSDPRTLVQLERQMKAARQLRAETMAGGFARALERVSSVMRRMVERLRGERIPLVPAGAVEDLPTSG